MDSLFIFGGAGLALVVFLFVLFKAMWRVAEPNEALIISGLRDHSTAAGTTPRSSTSASRSSPARARS